MRDSIQIQVLPEHSNRSESPADHFFVSLKDTTDDHVDLKDVTIHSGSAAVVSYDSPNAPETLRVVIARQDEEDGKYSTEYRAEGFTVFSTNRTMEVSAEASQRPITFYGEKVVIPVSDGKNYTLRADTVLWTEGSRDLHAQNAVLTDEAGHQVAKNRRLRVW